MSELPVLDEKERERVRRSLAAYKETHKIGYTKLYDRIYYTLDLKDLNYLSMSTMQRFVRGDALRTTDEAVWAMKTFLDRVTPTDRETKLATDILDGLVIPVMAKEQPVPGTDETELIPQVYCQPIENYQGIYDAYYNPYAGEAGDAEFGEKSDLSYAFPLIRSSDFESAGEERDRRPARGQLRVFPVQRFPVHAWDVFAVGTALDRIFHGNKARSAHITRHAPNAR